MERLKSFQYAFQGIRDLMATQPNARIHLAAGVLALAMAFWLDISRVEWILIIFAIVGVLAAEAFNTALEYLTDLVSPDYHQLAGKAKDAAAAAVLLTAIGAATTGLLIMGPKLWDRLSLFF